MLRRLSPLVLTAGLVATCAGSAAFSLHVAVLDTGRVRAGAGEVLRSAPVERAMTERIVAALRAQVPGTDAVPPQQLTDVATRVQRDPRFVSAFGAGVVGVQRHVFDGGPGLVLLPEAPVTAALRDAVTARAPALAGALPPGVELNVDIDARSVPNLEAVGHGIDNAMLALLVGTAALVVAIVTARPRRRAVARVARCMIGIGVFETILFGAVPRVVLWAFGPWAQVAGAYLRATMTPFVIASIVLTVGGAWALTLVHRLEVAAGRRAREQALADLARRTEWRPPAVERAPQRSR